MKDFQKLYKTALQIKTCRIKVFHQCEDGPAPSLSFQDFRSANSSYMKNLNKFRIPAVSSFSRRNNNFIAKRKGVLDSIISS
jgi:hypothetical protein